MKTKTHRYIGFGGALIFICLIFLEVKYENMFSTIGFISIGILLTYIALVFVLYAVSASWIQSAKQALRLILVPLVVGGAIRLLKMI